MVFATLNYTGTSITGAIVPFRFATSVIKANSTGLQANTVCQFKTKISDGMLPGKFSVATDRLVNFCHELRNEYVHR